MITEQHLLFDSVFEHSAVQAAGDAKRSPAWALRALLLPGCLRIDTVQVNYFEQYATLSSPFSPPVSAVLGHSSDSYIIGRLHGSVRLVNICGTKGY